MLLVQCPTALPASPRRCDLYLCFHVRCRGSEVGRPGWAELAACLSSPSDVASHGIHLSQVTGHSHRVLPFDQGCAHPSNTILMLSFQIWPYYIIFWFHLLVVLPSLTRTLQTSQYWIFSLKPQFLETSDSVRLSAFSLY